MNKIFAFGLLLAVVSIRHISPSSATECYQCQSKEECEKPMDLKNCTVDIVKENFKFLNKYFLNLPYIDGTEDKFQCVTINAANEKVKEVKFNGCIPMNNGFCANLKWRESIDDKLNANECKVQNDDISVANTTAQPNTTEPAETTTDESYATGTIATTIKQPDTTEAVDSTTTVQPDITTYPATLTTDQLYTTGSSAITTEQTEETSVSSTEYEVTTDPEENGATTKLLDSILLYLTAIIMVSLRSIQCF